MRMPTGMAARMAGAIVAVVLAATPGAAAADGGLPPLLPEAADEANDAPFDGESSAVGAVPAKAVPAEPAAGNETKVRDPNAPDSGNMDDSEVSPEPASRLLRALAELPGPAHAEPDEGPVGAAPVHAVDGCPRALLRRLLAGAADEGGALTALGIEREVLTLCRERQEIVAGLFETESRLRELRGESGALSPAPAVVQVASQPEARETAPSRPAQPSPLQAALAAAPKGPERPEETGPAYGWFSIIGTAGALRAGITDGTGVWFVREGDALPDGSAVVAIAARPPAVRIEDPDGAGGETLLSWQARPEAGP